MFYHNLDSIKPIFTLSNKIEGNNDYRDITNQDIDIQSVKDAITTIFNNTDVMFMILKNDISNRIAFIFDKIIGSPERFQEDFRLALIEANIDFKTGWMEEYQDLVYILQL